MKKLMKIGGQMMVGGIGLGAGMEVGTEMGANMGGVGKVSGAMPMVGKLATTDYLMGKAKKMGKKMY